MSHVLQQFHYSVTGPEQGRKWAFLHGLMGYSQNWRRIIMALEPTERCLVYDQRGHGRSFKPESGYTPEDYAKDLADILDDLGWDKIILVGHSMGGRNALAFAAMFPERMEKLVIEDIGPEKKAHQHDYYVNLLGSIPTPFPSRETAKDFFEHQFAQKIRTKENPKVLSQFLYANLEEKPNGQLDWRFYAHGIIDSVIKGRLEDRWDLVENIQCDTLLIRGQQSTELSPEIYQRMLNANPRITGVEIPNAGHWVHSEQPEAFIQAIKTFTSL